MIPKAIEQKRPSCWMYLPITRRKVAQFFCVFLAGPKQSGNLTITKGYRNLFREATIERDITGDKVFQFKEILSTFMSHFRLVPII